MILDFAVTPRFSLGGGWAGCRKRGAKVTFCLAFRWISFLGQLLLYFQPFPPAGWPPPVLRRHHPAMSPERDWTEVDSARLIVAQAPPARI